MMKPKHLIPLTLLAALTALGACISPQDEPADCQDCGQQQIILQVQESGGATTRAGRPLYSSEHKQLVDHVTLVVCYYGNNGDASKPDNQIAAIKHIDNWMKESTEDPDFGRRCYVSLMGSNRVPEGVAKYKVYAIGYTHQDQNETAYTTIPTGGTESKKLETYLKSLRIGQIFPENLTLDLSAPGEEIFAGTNTESNGLIQSNEAGGFTTEVILHRQVAGVYMYVSDIPYPDQARKLRLTAACDNDGLVLGQFDSEKYQNGQQDTTADKVVNGTNAHEGISNASRATLCTIDLADWKDNSGNWKNPYDAENKAPSFQTKSYFAGSFVIPFAAPSETNAQSLQLELWGDDTSKGTLQTWSVKLPDGDPQNGTFNLHIWDNNNKKFTTKEVTESPDAFSLLRNHLYCIGWRDADDGTGHDEPLPLSDANPIILQVVAEWDHVYDMELEPDAP